MCENSFCAMPLDVCAYVFSFSQPQQHKLKHKYILKADKKEAVKKDRHYRTCKQDIEQI